MNEPWDNRTATEEGWYLIMINGRCTIQAYYAFENQFNKPGPFVCGPGIEGWDAKALQFVKYKAAEGSAYHIDALARTQLL